MRKIYAWEPWFFIFFGLFHLHRIWALFAREAYASFWMGILQNKGVSYFLIMGILASLCVLGITIFIKNRKHNFWWRWVYLFGGGYLIFDLFAIAAGIQFWSDLLILMFDTSSSYWNVVWITFIMIGALSFTLGVYLLYKRMNINRTTDNCLYLTAIRFLFCIPTFQHYELWLLAILRINNIIADRAAPELTAKLGGLFQKARRYLSKRAVVF